MSCRLGVHAFMAVLLLAAILLGILLARTCHAKPLVYLIEDSQGLNLSLRPLVEAQGYEFRVEAIPGSSMLSWADHYPKSWARLRRARPALLLVSLGSNDACMGPRIVQNEEPFLRRFQAKLARVRAGRVVWLGPPAIGSTGKLHQAKEGLLFFVKLIESAGITYLDARSAQVQMWDDQLHCARPTWQNDPAHGCADWAAWVWTQLIQNGEIP